MRERLYTASGVEISIRHRKTEREHAIVIAHGFFQSKETKTFRKLEEDLASAFDTVSMDFRGHGKSKGLYTFSAREAEDLKAVVDYTREHHRKVGVLAFSYGAAVAIVEAAEFKNVDSLVCVCAPMASEGIEFRWWTPRAVRIGLRGLEPGAGARFLNPFLKKTRPIDVVANLAPTPVFFIHGAKDPLVTVRHSHALFERAHEPKEIFIFQEGTHAEELYRQFPLPFIRLLKNWFSKTLA
ncbi:MAG: alpha/beta hydrolase [Candidatus Omnitrophota bacterium]